MNMQTIFSTILKTALCVGMFITLPGCGGGTSTTAGSGDRRNATFELKDESGAPVVMAVIADLNGGEMAETDENGIAIIEVATDESGKVQVQITADGVSSDVEIESDGDFEAKLVQREDGDVEVEQINPKQKKKEREGDEEASSSPGESPDQGADANLEEEPTPTNGGGNNKKPKSPKSPEERPSEDETPPPTEEPELITVELDIGARVLEPGDTVNFSATVRGDVDESGNLVSEYEGKTVIFFVAEETSEATTFTFTNGFHTVQADSEDPFAGVSFQNYRATISGGKATFSFDLPNWLQSGIWRLRVQALVVSGTASYLYEVSEIENLRLVGSS